MQTWQLIRTFSPNKPHHRSFQLQTQSPPALVTLEGVKTGWGIPTYPDNRKSLLGLFKQVWMDSLSFLTHRLVENRLEHSLG